jgi:flagellar biosynthesis/type III secretory pathway chaperone
MSRLIRTLERLTALYGELLDCAKEKTKHLVACDIDAIEASQAREEMVVGKLSQLEKVRDAALREAAESIGCRQVPPTLSAMILMLSESDERAELLSLRNKLVESARELGASNRLNEQLCTQSLMHLEAYMGLLTGRTAKPQGYDARGRASRYEARALVSKSA